MKLLILNYEYPPLGGGAGVITQNIAEGLSKLGHEISVVTTWFQGEKEVEIVNDNLKIIRLKSKGNTYTGQTLVKCLVGLAMPRLF